MRLIKSKAQRAERRAHRIVRRRFRFMIDNYSLERLGGGASTRNYFRLLLPRLAGFKSSVLMIWNSGCRRYHRDFLELQRLLDGILLPVPAVYEDLETFGAAVLEDLGNFTLCDLMPGFEDDEAAVEELYRTAIDHLVTIQTRAGAYATGIKAFTRAFDRKKLLWEMEFTIKHFARSHLGYRPGGTDAEVLKSFFENLCARIEALPRVLCHRDYHSQNLMYYEGRLYIIDFQDARLGPHVYDLVSLLRDSYVELSDGLFERLFEYYVQRHPRFGPSDLEQLRGQFNLVALQRHLKHLGTFGRQAAIGRRRFLKYVPLTLRYLEENLPRFPEYVDAFGVLAGIFERAREMQDKEE